MALLVESPALQTAAALQQKLVLAEREQQTLPTAMAGVDRLLRGGLHRGALVEMVGQPSSGRFALVLASLAAVTSVGMPASLIDLGDHLDPHLAAMAGVDLPRLMWLRPRSLRDALASTEMVIGTAVPLVVLDLGLQPMRGARAMSSAWLRLKRAALAHRAALLVSTRVPVCGFAAQAVLVVRRRQTSWITSSPGLLLGLSSVLTRGKGDRVETEAVSLAVAPALQVQSEGEPQSPGEPRTPGAPRSSEDGQRTRHSA